MRHISLGFVLPAIWYMLCGSLIKKYLMDEKLRNFISRMHVQGKTDKDIRASLANAGWSESQIEREFENAVIHIDDLKKHFNKTKAVDGISFMVEKGEIFGFLGPNGAGKTTTIRCMMNFLNSDTGYIKILKKDTARYSVALKKEIGYLSGNYNLYEGWTGKEHIQFARSFEKKQDIANELIKRLNFDTNKKTKNLSSGNRQKLGIILALMFRPPVLILDEPTLALDPLLQKEVYALLREAANNGTTVFISSHNLAEVEQICNRVAIIKDGKLVAIDQIKNLQRKHMYQVHVYFEGIAPSREVFNGNGVEVVGKDDEGYSLKIKGDINEFLDMISDYDIRDITIGRVSLEEIFLEFYK